MKRFIFSISTILLIISITSCENQPTDFPDYKYSAIYFPYQYPVRTLILGDDEMTNTELDNKLQFKIGVTIEGLYENTQNRNVNYVIDTTLVKNLYTSEGTKLLSLPNEYFSLPETGTILIPKGQMQGYINIQLTDAFLDNTETNKTKYVIPVRIVSADADTILQGKSGFSTPDPRIKSDWYTLPKNFTIFGIKYINPYHGTYLHRGKDIYTNGTLQTTYSYTNAYVEKTEVKNLNTLTRNKVSFITPLRRTAGSPGNLSMILTFDANNNCTISSDISSIAIVSGFGKFVKEGDAWGGKKRNAIYLNYTFTDNNNETHSVLDTLVIRDRNVKLETYTPVIN